MTADSKRISDVLNKQFQSAFTSPLENMKISRHVEFVNTSKLQEEKVTISYIDITEEDVLSAINEINPNSVTGPDELLVILLKTSKKALAKSLQNRF